MTGRNDFMMGKRYEKPKTKYVLPAKLIDLDFVWNGEFHPTKGGYGDFRPKGKVHLKRGMAGTRCGLYVGQREDWQWYVRAEDICKKCLKDIFGHWITVELEL